MNLSGTEVRYGVSATANVSAVNVSGNLNIGTAATVLTYIDAPTVAYSLAMQIADGDTLTLDMDTGIVTGTVAGAFQVETSTIVAASGATTAGDLNVTVTSALVTGSPLVIPVALLLSDNTASLVATKVRAALTATAAITDHYTVGGTGADYSLTALVKAANDATLNLAHANDTSVGITTSTTSTDTTAGVAATLAYKISGTTWDATDAEGVALPAMTKVHTVLIRSSTDGATLVTDDLTNSTTYTTPIVSLVANPDGLHPWTGNTVDFTATGDVLLTLDIHAGE